MSQSEEDYSYFVRLLTNDLSLPGRSDVSALPLLTFYRRVQLEHRTLKYHTLWHIVRPATIAATAH